MHPEIQAQILDLVFPCICSLPVIRKRQNLLLFMWWIFQLYGSYGASKCAVFQN